MAACPTLVAASASLPVILHGLGEVFDPQLGGYWGSSEVPVATRAFLELIAEQRAKVDGVSPRASRATSSATPERWPLRCPSLAAHRLSSLFATAGLTR